MQNETISLEESAVSSGYEEIFESLERDARRYSRAFTEEEEAKRI